GGEENEENVSIDQVPAAVKATILAEAQGADIQEIERETKNGKTVYEAEWNLDGKEIEIKVAEDGTLLKREMGDDEEEENISLDQLPAEVREALLKLAGNAQITEVEREQKHGIVLYQAEWGANGHESEATVTADGVLVELEQELDAKDVPAAVKAAAAKNFPPGVKLEYEKKMIVMYEVEAKVDGKEKEIMITPVGKVLDHKKHSGRKPGGK
ncbi:MAG: PepSY-like domain-containing protein, partial [Planctomycetota bacterium]